ncbi:MAG: hypothetical protein V7L14_29665 [Nostoc sp.]|uniref:hypothetical protein n=1 Tax=Nostoc sp. TaxID=1180 RepID=UPI002FF9A59A
MHIETASRHLLRGQEQEDETAFTDAIYRTNQAFEGSLKEAYRILAERNPERESPYNIEKFFEGNSVFRQRVLAQFTNYRTEWRNPSSHDYQLDFDESEAFLAIVSVAAFACLVLDQITEKISYLQVKTEADTKQIEIQERLTSVEKGDLLNRTTEILREFSHQQPNFNVEGSKRTEAQFAGQLSGFFASVAPDIEVISEYKILAETAAIADFVISDRSSRVLIEIKRARQSIDSGVAQVERYMLLSGIKSAILYFFSDAGGELEIQERNVSNVDGKILILKPLV